MKGEQRGPPFTDFDGGQTATYTVLGWAARAAAFIWRRRTAATTSFSHPSWGTIRCKMLPLP